MTKRKLFTLTFLITTAVVSLGIFLKREKFAEEKPRIVRVTSNTSITHQLEPIAIPFIRSRGFDTIVDIRPDGEAPDQTSSGEIEKAAQSGKLEFHYIPVPHEAIPDQAVDTLAAVLKVTEKQTLLYCRTGRRAVRLLALAEASRVNGPALEEILKMVSNAGFSAEDLRENIANRISNRIKNPETGN